jgi:hypothetical protein
MGVLTLRRLGVLALTALLAPVAAFAGSTPEAEVNAGLLYNFARFVEWPVPMVNGNRDLVICLVGGDPLGQLAGEMTGRRVNDRIIRVELRSTNADPRGCHVMFMVALSDADVAAILKRAGDAPILTIGSSPGFIAAGGIVRLFQESGRMRFEINLARVERTGLRMSSKVLSMARVVRLPSTSMRAPSIDGRDEHEAAYMARRFLRLRPAL